VFRKRETSTEILEEVWVGTSRTRELLRAKAKKKGSRPGILEARRCGGHSSDNQDDSLEKKRDDQCGRKYGGSRLKEMREVIPDSGEVTQKKNAARENLNGRRFRAHAIGKGS